MNEITRIHIAKTAYDIEVAAKKQLEKYIKSLETYTKDPDVLADVEIRMTELLMERGVKAGGVIASDDVDAIRKQLGEPYEFADGDGDIAVGSVEENSGRRLYRSTDNAVLGGVLSGMAAYFNVNPLWTRLVFILLLFISFGFASLAYILFWILTPPARTATEKLQLAGKGVTLESIKELNADEEMAKPNRVAPALQQFFSIAFGALSALIAVGALVGAITLVVAALTLNTGFVDATNGFMGMGAANSWIVWLVFWIVVLGIVLAAMLFGLIAYAFFAKKLTKRMVISGIVIIALGIASVGTSVGIAATQSWRVANEARSQVDETKANLPKEFAGVKTAKFAITNDASQHEYEDLFSASAEIRYVVDEGPARYELTALPTAKPTVKVDGETATITLNIPKDYRNSFVQPVFTVYGPALTAIEVENARVNYAATTQDALLVTAKENTQTWVGGSFSTVTVKGAGSVDLGSSSVQTLDVQAEHNLTVSAGTVRELKVVQPDVCPSYTYDGSTSVTVSGVTSGTMLYNGASLPAATHQTGCASVTIEPIEQGY